MKNVLIILLAIIFLGVAGYVALTNGKKEVQMEKAQSSNTKPTPKGDSLVTPISHATMVLHVGNQIVYTDPVGGAEVFKGQPGPDLILVTDIHGDHFNPDTLRAVSQADTVIVVPQAVKDMLPSDLRGTIVVMANGEKTTQRNIEIEAIPMYNMPENVESPHTKGRGNGYVISAEGKRIYIAGDTSATPEMRALKNIDVAFVPMNLPYTMSVEEAADGVATFKPKVVIPYHYRGQDGLSDTKKFKELVQAADPKIKVELLDFYREQ